MISMKFSQDMWFLQCVGSTNFKHLCILVRRRWIGKQVTIAYSLSVSFMQMTVSVFGFIGNSLTFYILSTAEMSCFKHLLRALLVFHTLFLSICVLDYSVARVFQWPFSNLGEFYAIIFPKFLYPLSAITACGSSFLTVAIALER